MLDRTAEDVFDFALGKPGKNGAKPSSSDAPPFSAADLQNMALPDVRYIIPGLLPEGLCVLAGKPKLGKSWLGLGVSVAVASGGYALGSIKVERGDVLYLALEDNQRRLQKRMRSMLPNDRWPARLFLHTQWPRLNAQGVAKLGAWLDDHPDTRLVIIDTLAKIRPKREGKNGGAGYAEDYSDIEQLQELAARYQIAILLVHHARKLSAEDWLDEISGTLGIAGGADGAMLLKRARGEGMGTLAVTGRDLDEESELALIWDASICNWRESGTAAAMRMSKKRQAILDILRAAPLGMTPTAIAADIKDTAANVRQLLRSMLDDKQVMSPRTGVYMAPSPEATITLDHAGDHAGERRPLLGERDFDGPDENDHADHADHAGPGTPFSGTKTPDESVIGPDHASITPSRQAPNGAHEREERDRVIDVIADRDFPNPEDDPDWEVPF